MTRLKSEIIKYSIFIVSLFISFAVGYWISDTNGQRELDRILEHDRQEARELRNILEEQNKVINTLEQENKQSIAAIENSKRSIDSSIAHVKQIKVEFDRLKDISVSADREIGDIRKSVADFKRQIEAAGEG